VQNRRAKTVVAETYKAKGASVRIAVAPGEYEVLVRRGSTLSRCQVTAGPGGGAVDLERCATEEVVAATRKGGGFLRPTRIELFGGFGNERSDAYTETLGNFGYKKEFLGISAGVGMSATRQIDRRLWVGAMLTHTDSPRYTRTDSFGDLEIDWTTTSLMGVARGIQRVGDVGPSAQFGFYGQLAAGVGMGRTSFTDVDDSKTRETHFGPSVVATAGIEWGNPNVARPNVFEGLTLSLGFEMSYAPVIDNEVGDTHASGGGRVIGGISYSY
jgi:hypothetical protein